MLEELPVNQKTYDLIVWFTKHLDNFPKSRRSTLGKRIEDLLYDLLELLIDARYTGDKEEKIRYLKKANTKLEKLRYFIRLSHEQNLMGHGQYEFVSGKVHDIGQSLGGWLKDVTKRK
jgi:hypothetical protein